MQHSKRIVAVHDDFGIFLGIDGLGRSWFSRHGSNGLSVAVTFTSEQNANFVLSTRLAGLPRDMFKFYSVDTGGYEWATILQLAHAGIPPEQFGDLVGNLDPIGSA